MYASQKAARRSPAAQITHCLRVGSPPYRFSGWRLTRDEVAAGGDKALFVELWQRQKGGGYVLAFSRLTGTAWHPDACNALTIDAAMEEMERICATQTVGQFAPSECLTGALSDQIRLAAILHNQLNKFQQLVGQALDIWMDLDRSS